MTMTIFNAPIYRGRIERMNGQVVLQVTGMLYIVIEAIQATLKEWPVARSQYPQDLPKITIERG